MSRTPHRIPSTQELLTVAKTASQSAQNQGIRAIVIGGLAMQLYGSPRLTQDIDFAADQKLKTTPSFVFKKTLHLGGATYRHPTGIELDWLVRDDEYASLFNEAIDRSRRSKEGILLVTPEYLAAMKFLTARPKDYEDLMYLLSRPRLAHIRKTRDIVYRLVGGRFAADQFDAAVEEARWRARRDRNRS